MIFVFRDALRDPQIMAGHELDAYGLAWGRRLQRLPGAFARGYREPDADYRARILDLIKSRIEA